MNDSNPHRYSATDLRRENLDPNPLTQFSTWFEDAKNAISTLPEALTLATADERGRPSARQVLLKGFDDDGFTFFTNYDSRKALELTVNPHAALVFWWPPLERQVRIEGTVDRVSDEESDGYFASRPRGSQLGAWASNQSGTIEDDVLQKRLDRYETEFMNREVPRPPHWGGFRLRAVSIEFWQGKPDRLHDRFRYRLDAGAWVIERLAP